MADRSRGEGWWQASDGKWYPPELLDAPRQQWPTTDLTPVVPAASTTAVSPGIGTQVSVGVSAVFSGATAVTGFMFASAVRRSGVGWDTDADAIAARDLWLNTSAMWFLTLIVAAVLVITWSYRVSKAMTARGAEGRKWAPGWAIGSWFVPFANLLIPRLVFAEMERCASEPYRGTPIEHRWVANHRFSIGDVWWFLWVTGNLVSYLATAAGNGVTAQPGSYATYLTIGSMGSLIGAGAGVALILEIRALVSAAAN